MLAGVPTRPGLSAGDNKATGVRTRGRTPVLHLAGSGIICAVCDLAPNLCVSVHQGRTLSPFYSGGF